MATQDGEEQVPEQVSEQVSEQGEESGAEPGDELGAEPVSEQGKQQGAEPVEEKDDEPVEEQGAEPVEEKDEEPVEGQNGELVEEQDENQELKDQPLSGIPGRPAAGTAAANANGAIKKLSGPLISGEPRTAPPRPGLALSGRPGSPSPSGASPGPRLLPWH